MTAFESGVVRVGNSYVMVHEETLSGPCVITFEVLNDSMSGTDPLTSFIVQVQAHEDAEWIDYLDDNDWDNPNLQNLPMRPDSTFSTLASGSRDSAVIVIRHPWHAVRWRAKAGAAAVASIQVRGQIEPLTITGGI